MAEGYNRAFFRKAFDMLGFLCQEVRGNKQRESA